jgi:hypothetical protein
MVVVDGLCADQSKSRVVLFKKDFVIGEIYVWVL